MVANTDIAERIKELVRDYGHTQAEFAERIGTDASNFSKALNGRLAINDTLINKIVVALGVSKEWLKNGVGGKHVQDGIPTMLINESSIAMQPSGTPVYDLDVTAGVTPRDRMFASEYRIGTISMPGINRECRIVKAAGDSMQPVICDGDYIALRIITNYNIIYWGQIYVVVLDDFRMVKRVCKHADADKVILRSENDCYDDIEVKKSDIRELFFVQNIIRISTRE